MRFPRPRRPLPALAALVLLLATATPSLVAATSAPAKQSAGAHPNVVLIVADDLDVASLGEMPNLRSLLVEQGASFTNAFVTTSLCCPSRASILRGQYAHTHGVLTNAGQDGGFPTYDRLDREEDSLPTWLDAAGYETGLVGKYLNGYPKGTDAAYVPPGWDRWRAVASRVPSYFDYTLNEDGRLVPYGSEPASYSTDVIGDQVAEFVTDAATGGEPFFAYVAPYAPHWPSVPAPCHAEALPDAAAPRSPSFDEADVADKPEWVRNVAPLSPAAIADLDARQRDRLRSLLALDDAIARIVAALEESGTLADTFLVFTSDNGFHLGEHRLAQGKQTPYDEAIRVPLIVRGPGIVAGSRVDDLALNIDIAPTVAELAGATAPGFVDGRSLAPLLTELAGDVDHGSWRTGFLVERFDPVKRGRRAGAGAREEAAAAEGDEEIAVPPYAALRTADWLYVEYGTGERELYDLRADPYQLDNLAAVAPEVTIDAFAARLALLRDCAAAGCRSAEEAPLSLPTPGR